ncbi:hypothetical protein [Nocardiopsis metallicus]|uniref:hypothetical protein n=1 Tax=Nocardiopsis metallicus TaxID=179819 RepID=UPI0031D599F1
MKIRQPWSPTVHEVDDTIKDRNGSWTHCYRVVSPEATEVPDTTETDCGECKHFLVTAEKQRARDAMRDVLTAAAKHR